MKTFSQWCLLLALWAIVVIALLLGSPVHAQFAAGSASSSSTTSSSSSSTTTTTTAAPQILQLPTMAYQAPLPCPTANFGVPMGYGRSFGTGFGYGRNFGAGFGYGRNFGAGFGYGHSMGFRRGFAAPVYGGAGFAVPRRAAFAVPVAPVVPVKVGLFGRLRVPRGFRR